MLQEGTKEFCKHDFMVGLWTQRANETLHQFYLCLCHS